MKTKEKLIESSELNHKCPICNNNFWIIDNNGNAKRCKCWEREKQRRKISFANIPMKYKEATFDNYKTEIYSSETMQKIKELCREYTEKFDKKQKGLFLSSHVKGSGKTRMAATICNTLMDKGISVKFATSSSIIEEIKKTWDKNNAYTESSLIDALISTDVLVVDDFGTESLREWVNDKFYYIINERYINERTTLYTSNYKINELAYDERIINRIRETCYYIPFPEESIREQIAKDNIKEMAGMLREQVIK